MTGEFLDSRLLVAVASAVIGFLVTLAIQALLNKRGQFTYFVRHDRVGVTADDAVFGSVRVTWNENPVANLYSSTIELVNESLKDYDNVAVRVYTNNATLLGERTEVKGTTHMVEWTGEFADQLRVPAGQAATETQLELYSRQRDYLIPTMNRGQVIRFSFLNAATSNAQPPAIWLDVLHKGVKARFRPPNREFMGVPEHYASLLGIIIGFLFVGLLLFYVQSVWIAAVLSLFYGFFVKLPGVLVIRLWRGARAYFGD